MPITWSNIESDHTRGAASLFETARRALNDGMGNFKGIVDSRNELNQQNWDTQKKINTDQFLDRLAQYKTPEELAAAQAAGDLDALKAQFGAQIDRDAVRDAEANQTDVLMRRIAAQNQYADDKTNRDARPLVDQFNALRAAGKLDKAQKFLEDNVLGVDESPFAQSLLDRRDKVFDQRISQGQLNVSQRQVSLDELRNSRDQKLFDQTQEEYLGKRAAGVLVQDMIGSGKDLAVLRGDLTRQAEEGNWSPTVTDFALKDLESKYAATLDITPEQQKTMDGSLAPYVSRHDLATKNNKRIYESTLDQLPLNQEYAFTDKDYVPEGETIGQIAKDSGSEAFWDDNDDPILIKGDEMANKYVGQILNEVEDKYGVVARDTKGNPLRDEFGNPVKSFTTDKVKGLLLKRAYSKVVGTDDWIGSDKSINRNLLKKAYEDEVKNYMMFEANRHKRLELEEKHAEEQARLDAELAAKRTEEANKFRTINLKARLRNN